MKRLRSLSVILIIVFLIQMLQVLPLAADESFYARKDENTYRIRTTYIVANTGSYSAYNIRVMVRLGVSSSSPYQTNLSYFVEPAADIIKRDAAGNIFGEIVFHELKPGEKKTISVDKYFANSGISYSEEIYNIDCDYSSFKNNPTKAFYLQPSEKIESSSVEIKEKLRDFNLKKAAAKLAKDIYDFVNLHIDYDSSSLYANKGALSGLLNKKGVCDEYASLFTALCRAAGIPARVVSGYWIDESIKSGEWMNISGKRHAWSEFFVEGVGWVPAEPTLLYTYNGIRKPNSEYFANIKPSDRHFITGYTGKKAYSELSMYYACYEDTTVSARFGDEKIIRVDNYSGKSYFTDINTSWAKSFIDKLYNQGVIFGSGDTFEPTLNITRAEFSAYLVNALGLEEGDASLKFKDVTSDHRLAEFINIAASNGLIKGYQGYFRPEDYLSRQDAAVIMERAIKLVNKDT
ncbi:MAG: transglutaminase domain-containing protein, partial [Bacillota bacterium]